MDGKPRVAVCWRKNPPEWSLRPVVLVQMSCLKQQHRVRSADLASLLYCSLGFILKKIKAVRAGGLVLIPLKTLILVHKSSVTLSCSPVALGCWYTVQEEAEGLKPILVDMFNRRWVGLFLPLRRWQEAVAQRIFSQLASGTILAPKHDVTTFQLLEALFLLQAAPWAWETADKPDFHMLWMNFGVSTGASL